MTFRGYSVYGTAWTSDPRGCSPQCERACRVMAATGDVERAVYEQVLGEPFKHWPLSKIGDKRDDIGRHGVEQRSAFFRRRQFGMPH